MPTVMDILASKGDQIFSISPAATVLEAVRKMNDQSIGALVVMQGDRMIGMFTERDVLRRVMAERRSPGDVRVLEVMTRDVICVPPETDIDEAGQLMRQKRVRHLPVVDDHGRLLGIISIGDLNAVYSSHQEQTISQLHDYIYGRA
jgi:CBS domain-containing protein